MRLVVSQLDCSPKVQNKGKWPFACHGIPPLALEIHILMDPWHGPVLAHQGTQDLKWPMHTLHTNSSKLWVIFCSKAVARISQEQYGAQMQAMVFRVEVEHGGMWYFGFEK